MENLLTQKQFQEKVRALYKHILVAAENKELISVMSHIGPDIAAIHILHNSTSAVSIVKSIKKGLSSVFSRVEIYTSKEEVSWTEEAPFYSSSLFDVKAQRKCSGLQIDLVFFR